MESWLVTGVEIIVAGPRPLPGWDQQRSSPSTTKPRLLSAMHSAGCSLESPLHVCLKCLSKFLSFLVTYTHTHTLLHSQCIVALAYQLVPSPTLTPPMIQSSIELLTATLMKMETVSLMETPYGELRVVYNKC